MTERSWGLPPTRAQVRQEAHFFIHQGREMVRVSNPAVPQTEHVLPVDQGIIDHFADEYRVFKALMKIAENPPADPRVTAQEYEIAELRAMIGAAYAQMAACGIGMHDLVQPQPDIPVAPLNSGGVLLIAEFLRHGLCALVLWSFARGLFNPIAVNAL